MIYLSDLWHLGFHVLCAVVPDSAHTRLKWSIISLLIQSLPSPSPKTTGPQTIPCQCPTIHPTTRTIHSAPLFPHKRTRSIIPVVCSHPSFQSSEGWILQWLAWEDECLDERKLYGCQQRERIAGGLRLGKVGIEGEG